MNRRAFLVPLLLVALVAGACGGNDAGAGGGSTDATSATGGETGGGGDRYGGYGAGGGGAGETGATAATASTGPAGPSVEANNFLFDPSELEVGSGDILTVRNANARTPHTFTVEGTDIDVELAPLSSEEVEVSLDPGTYDFHCRFHAEMTGTLTVT